MTDEKQRPPASKADAEFREAPTDSLAVLLARPTPNAAAPHPGEIVIGQLCAVDEGGGPRVAWPGGPDLPVPAASLVPVTVEDVGRSVALGFPAGAGQALVLGLLWQPVPMPAQAVVDGRHVEIEAAETLTLRCGQASITLTADGQVLLRGSYVSSHSTGTQRIKGAAVRIN